MNIGAQILDEGLAYRAADIDVVWTRVTASRAGAAAHVPRQTPWASPTWCPSIEKYWPVAPLLRQLAADGRTFADWDRARES